MQRRCNILCTFALAPKVLVQRYKTPCKCIMQRTMQNTMQSTSNVSLLFFAPAVPYGAQYASAKVQMQKRSETLLQHVMHLFCSSGAKQEQSGIAYSCAVYFFFRHAKQRTCTFLCTIGVLYICKKGYRSSSKEKKVLHGSDKKFRLFFASTVHR